MGGEALARRSLETDPGRCALTGGLPRQLPRLDNEEVRGGADCDRRVISDGIHNLADLFELDESDELASRLGRDDGRLRHGSKLREVHAQLLPRRGGWEITHPHSPKIALESTLARKMSASPATSKWDGQGPRRSRRRSARRRLTSAVSAAVTDGALAPTNNPS